eukprot:Amastigsp_a180_895.p2 type:complete len:155 gc:universal Amastigsp_a180_895:261-725(+)
MCDLLVRVPDGARQADQINDEGNAARDVHRLRVLPWSHALLRLWAQERGAGYPRHHHSVPCRHLVLPVVHPVRAHLRQEHCHIMRVSGRAPCSGRGAEGVKFHTDSRVSEANSSSPASGPPSRQDWSRRADQGQRQASPGHRGQQRHLEVDRGA